MWFANIIFLLRTMAKLYSPGISKGGVLALGSLKNAPETLRGNKYLGEYQKNLLDPER
jgi:hypothetical protein